MMMMIIIIIIIIGTTVPFESRPSSETSANCPSRILDSPAIASLDFVTMFFSGAGCQPCVQSPAILEDRMDRFLVWVFVTDHSGMGGPTSSYITASIAP